MLNNNIKNPIILHVLPSLETIGGVEKNTLETVCGLIKKDFGKHHIASDGYLSPSNEDAKIEYSSITHHPFKLASKNPLIILLNAWKIRNIILKHNIHIIHAHSRAPAWSSLIASKITSTPMVSTYHGAYSHKTKLKKWYNSVMVRCDTTIAISYFIREHILQLYPSTQPILIPEGIDVEYFDENLVCDQRLKKIKEVCKIKNDIPLILIVGRITPLKGHLVLAQALHSLPHKNYQAIFLGGSKSKKHYAEQVRLACTDLPVSFIENIDDMPALYKLTDLVISCSTQPESFGRSIAESLFMGKKVIATNHGGAIELSKNGTYATLVPPNDPHSLGTAIIKELCHVLNESVIQNQKTYIKDNYSIHQMLNKIQSLYQSIYIQGMHKT